MKLSLATLAAVAVADDKKVPPRHPLQRLNNLKKFVTRFSNINIIPILNRATADRFESRIHRMLNSFQDSFERDTCDYYSGAQTQHGGPDPNPDLRPNGKPRQRRDDNDDYIEADFDDFESFCKENEGSFGKSILRSLKTTNFNLDQEMHHFCCSLHTDGHTDVDFCGSNAPRSTVEVNYERLSRHPSLMWKQITTGMRKWAERYIKFWSPFWSTKAPIGNQSYQQVVHCMGKKAQIVSVLCSFKTNAFNKKTCYFTSLFLLKLTRQKLLLHQTVFFRLRKTQIE